MPFRTETLVTRKHPRGIRSLPNVEVTSLLWLLVSSLVVDSLDTYSSALLRRVGIGQDDAHQHALFH